MKLPTIPRTYSSASARLSTLSVMRASGFIAGGPRWGSLVATMSHGLAAAPCNSLKQEGNSCDRVVHGTGLRNQQKPLVSSALPAGFGPAADGVEVRYLECAP